MDVRSDKADERVEEQEDLARKNLADVKIRGRRATEATKLAYKASTLGANDDQIAAAMSNGMAGINDFVELLKTARSDMSGGELGPDDINALIDLQGIPDMEYGSYEEMANQVYGATKTQPTEMAAIPGWAKLLGLSADEEAKRELATTPFASGLTVQQINDMSSEPEYQGLPGLEATTMTYKRLPRMNAEKGMDWSIDLNTSITEMQKDPAYLRIIRDGHEVLENMIEEEATQDELAAYKAGIKARTGKYIRDRIDVTVNSTADVYKTTFWKNGSVINLFDGLIKAGVYTTEDVKEMTRGLIEPTPEDPDANDPRNPKSSETETEIKTDPVITPRPRNIPSILLSGKIRESKGKFKTSDKLDENGVRMSEPIIVEPRPEETETREETKLISGRKVKVYLAAEWDKEYGDTHDPVSGYPLPIPGLEKYFGTKR